MGDYLTCGVGIIVHGRQLGSCERSEMEQGWCGNCTKRHNLVREMLALIATDEFGGQTIGIELVGDDGFIGTINYVAKISVNRGTLRGENGLDVNHIPRGKGIMGYRKNIFGL